MMIDYLEIGPTPAEEECEQLGLNYDPTKARKECRAYIKQLRREFGPEPNGARLFVKINRHDFGEYLEVACEFTDETSYAYALRCEDSSPVWDTIARLDLNLVK